MCSVFDIRFDELSGRAADAKRTRLAWRLFESCSRAADRQKRYADVSRFLTLGLTFMVVLFAVLKQQFDAAASVAASSGGAGAEITFAARACYYGTIVTPLLITALVALNARFDPETQRDELRTAAASLESEIYKFRTRTCEYGRLSAMGVSSGGAERGDNAATASTDAGPASAAGARPAREIFREQVAAIWDALGKSSVVESSMPTARTGDFSRKLSQRVALGRKHEQKFFPDVDEDEERGATNTAAAKKAKAAKGRVVKGTTVAPAPTPDVVDQSGRSRVDPDRNEILAASGEGGDDDSARGGDDGCTPLTAEEYVPLRVLPKLVEYSLKAPWQARILAVFEILSVVLAFVASLLGALEYVVPLPVLAAAGAAFAGWQSYRQMKDRLRLTNAAIGQLTQLLVWWRSLSMIQKRDLGHKDRLVRVAETMITSAEPALALRKSMESSKSTDTGGDGGGGDTSNTRDTLTAGS